GVVVGGGDLVAGLVEDLLLGPGPAAVGGHLDEAEVPVGLDLVVVPHPEPHLGPGGHLDVAGHGDVGPLLVHAGPPGVAPAVRVDHLERFGGQVHPDAVLGELGRAGGLADGDEAAAVAGVEHLGVGPAEHPLAPQAHVGGHGLEDRAGVGAAGHQVPEVDGGAARAGGVVQVGQAEVVAVLVGEDADAGVLGLHDVVGDLQVGAGHLVAARDGAGVRPDGVGALGAAVGGLVLAGVDQHQVVDHAVRLGEVAVAVGVGDVFEVVVGPREVGLGLGERVDGVDGELSGAERVVGVAGHVLGCASAGRRTVPGLGVR